MAIKRIVLIAALGWACTGAAQAERPVPIMPENLRWFSPSGNPSLQAAWVMGGEQLAGPYILRVKLAAGGKFPPHTHPDARHSTVLSGTLYVGFGERFDAAKLVAIPAGAVYVAPAHVAHYLWAKEGDVVYQESGFAPTATTLIP